MTGTGEEHPPGAQRPSPDASSAAEPWWKYYRKGLLWATFWAGAACSLLAARPPDPAHSLVAVVPAPRHAPTPAPALARRAPLHGGRNDNFAERPRPVAGPPPAAPVVPMRTQFAAAEPQSHEWRDGKREALLRTAIDTLSLHGMESSSVTAVLRDLTSQWPESRSFTVGGDARAAVVGESTRLARLLLQAAPTLSPPAVLAGCCAIASLAHRERRLKAPLRESLRPAFDGLAERARQVDVLERYNASELVILLWSIAKLRKYGDLLAEDIVERLSVQRMTESLTAKELATLVWATARMRLRSERMLVEVGRHLVQPATLPGLDSIGIQTVMWGFAKLGVRRPVLLSYIARQAVLPEVLRGFNAFRVANVLWSLATLQVSDREVIKPLCDYVKLPAVLDHQYEPIGAWGLARIAWSLATLNYPDAELLERLVERALAPELIWDFDAQAICNFLWACAKLQVKDPVVVVDSFKQLIMEELVRHSFSPQEVAVLAWSIAQLGHYDKPLVDLLQWSVLYGPNMLPAMDGRDITQLMWAMATFKAVNPTFSQALAFQLKTAPKMLPQSPIALSLLVWAFARLDHSDARLMSRISYRLMLPNTRVQVTAGFLAQVLWAFGHLRIRNTQFYASVAQRVMELRQDFTALAAANVVWSFAVAGVPNGPMLVSLADRLLAVVDAVDHTFIGRIAWAYANLNFYYDKLMEELSQRAVREHILPRLDAQSLVDLLWAHAVFDLREEAVLEALLSEFLRRPELQQQLHPYSLVKALWAQGRLQVSNATLVAALSRRLITPEVLETLNAEGCANAAWAFSQLELGEESVLLEVTKQVLKPSIMLTLKPPLIAKLAVAYAHLRYNQPELAGALADKAIRWLQPQIPVATNPRNAFSVEDLASFCWALGALQYEDNFLMLLISNRLADDEQLWALDTKSLLSIAWAFGRLGVDDVRFRNRLEARANQPDIADSLSPQLLWYIGMDWGRTGIRNAALLDACHALLGEGPTTRNLAAVSWRLGQEERQRASANL